MTEERIITAAVVTSGEKGDGPELTELLETCQDSGIEVYTIIGDAAYSGKENLKMAGEQEIKIVAKLIHLLHRGLENKKILLTLTRMPEYLYVRQGTWL